MCLLMANPSLDTKRWLQSMELFLLVIERFLNMLKVDYVMKKLELKVFLIEKRKNMVWIHYSKPTGMKEMKNKYLNQNP